MRAKATRPKLFYEGAHDGYVLPHMSLSESVLALEPRFMFDAAGMATGAGRGKGIFRTAPAPKASRSRASVRRLFNPCATPSDGQYSPPLLGLGHRHRHSARSPL